MSRYGRMCTNCASHVGVAVARRVLDELSARLALPLPSEARPGADLWVRLGDRAPWPSAPPLLRAADGWIHPGPPTAWSTFTDMVLALGAPAPGPARRSRTSVRSRSTPSTPRRRRGCSPRPRSARPPRRQTPVPELTDRSIADATVVVLGTAWATPLVGHLSVLLGARVLKVDHPRRPDPFPLAGRLTCRQEHHRVDLRLRTRPRSVPRAVGGRRPAGRRTPAAASSPTPDSMPARRASMMPQLSVVHVAAFADSDRPGYGPAAEAHGGWAARHDPPRLARSSVADPVAGFLGAIAAVDLLTARAPGASARVSLEGAVGAPPRSGAARCLTNVST